MAKQRPYISALWHAVPSNIQELLAQTIQAGVEAHKTNGRPMGKIPSIFFRADDIAIPSTACRNMLRIFAEYDTPLGLAVVPAWSTAAHVEALLSVAPEKNHLWCWHQHGWSHVNHATHGRSCEFGNDRKHEECAEELQQGHDTLKSLFGDTFYPVFTPPWNRISDSNIQILKDIGWKAISRTATAPYQDILPDIPVNVDLHTRNELTAASGWKGLLAELRAGIASGRCGVMMHHDRMNSAAEEFLQRLLIILQSYPVQPVPIYSYML
ncbi:polysaccharide deacetylase family protein [Halodesulfovibrio aestuarii]|uniref:polysaccharide deacetylase family protein n=1 Tax=Halodesulfovibrio aestuarii TaxID=126333 RepID=UPI00041205EA